LDWLDAETPQKLRIDLNGPIGKWHVLAYFNWEDLPKETALSSADFRLPEDDYWVRSFWDQRVWRAAKGNGLFRGRLGPHCSLLLAVRPAREAHAVYLGSSLHISQGLEIDEWEEGINSLSINISPGRSTQAKIDIYLPQKPGEVKFEDKPVSYKKLNDRCYRFEVDISQHGRLNLNY
jgi:alpha-galactosidase